MGRYRRNNTMISSWVLIIITPILGLFAVNSFGLMTYRQRRFANSMGLLYFVVLKITFESADWYFPIKPVFDVILNMFSYQG